MIKLVFSVLLTTWLLANNLNANDRYNQSFAILVNDLCKLIKPKTVLTTSLDFCGSTKVILAQNNKLKFIAIEEDYDFLLQVGRSLAKSYMATYSNFRLIEEESTKQITSKFLTDNFSDGLDFAIIQNNLVSAPETMTILLNSLTQGGLALVIFNGQDNFLDLNNIFADNSNYYMKKCRFYDDQIVLISKSASIIQSAEKLALRSLRKFYSQVGQDRFVYTKFFEQLGDNYQGTFVEIGAHDGITHSNSLFFEKELGWRGVCIEPRASAFNLLIKNRKCDCLKACIAANNGKKLFLEVEGYAAELSGLVDLYDPKHRERIDREIAQYGGKSKIVEVDCIDFSTLCQRYGLKTIDFMSIDTEGCELEILRNIDFSKIEIKVIAVENNYGSSEIQALMKANGFVFLGKLSNDEIYLKNYNQLLIERR